MEQQKDSRLNFLKAGLLVGGAMYADPAAALARTGGRFFIEPDHFLYPPKTPIAQFIPGSYLPGSTGKLTLGDFAAIADLNDTTLLKLARKFTDVTLGDIGDIISYQVTQFGSSQTLFANSSGQESIFSCCCCCTTIKIAL
jgi:hypothetical protein